MRLACVVAGFFLLIGAALVTAGELGDESVTASDAARPDRVTVSQDASRSGGRESPASTPSSAEPTPAAPEPTTNRGQAHSARPPLETGAASSPPADAHSGPTHAATRGDTEPDVPELTVPAPSPSAPSAATATGGKSPSPTSTRVAVDRAAPQTMLDGAPAEREDSDEAEFVFHANEPATFTCSLDGGAYRPCGSETEYDDLAAGWHDFAVRATDDSGNVDGTPATWRWHTAPRGD
jgi:large repetitive protein